MKTSYGPFYAHSRKGTRQVKQLFNVRRTTNQRWAIYDTATGQTVHTGFPTRLRAYYAATKMNGTDVSVVFNFGSAMFG